MSKSAFTVFLDELAKLGNNPAKPIKAATNWLCVFGENEFLKLLYIKSFKHRLPYSGVTVFDGNRADWTEFYDGFGQTDLFGESQLFQLNLGDQKADVAKRLQAIPKQSNHGLLINLKTKKLGDKLKAVLMELGVHLISAVEPAPFEVPLFVQKRAEALGLNLAPDLASQLLDYCGTDLVQIENELAQLALLFPGGEKITRLAAQVHLNFLREDAGFRLRQLILDGKKSQAVCLLVELIRRGESPLALMGLLSKHIRQSLQIIDRKREGASDNSIMSALSLHPGTYKRYTTYCRRIDKLRLRQAWQCCLKLDRAFKSTTMQRDDIHLMELVDLLA